MNDQSIALTSSSLEDEPLHRTSELPIWFDNFANLAQAYEGRLNESDPVIEPNDLRLHLLTTLLGTPPSEAYYLVQGLAWCREVEGDVCEFGVAQGETSALIANEIAGTDKTLHLFDSFQGLPAPSEKDHLLHDIFDLGNMEAYRGKMRCREGMVLERLRKISFPEHRYVIHKGFFDRILERGENLPARVSFTYVDFDLYEPIKQVLEFLHPITPPGAIIIVDDYGFFSSGPKTAVDEFIQDKNDREKVYEYMIPDTRYGHFIVLSKKG